MNNDVKEYICWLFENAPPIQLLRVQEALRRRPSATVEELKGLYESDRILSVKSGIKFAEEIAAGGVGVRAIMYPKVGDCFENHAHTYDHLTYLAKGSVIAYAPDNQTEKVFHAPRMIMTRAGVKHQFVANEDDTHMMCLHRTDELEERGIPFTVVEPDNLIDG